MRAASVTFWELPFLTAVTPPLLLAGQEHKPRATGNAAKRKPLGRAGMARASGGPEEGVFAPVVCEVTCTGVDAVETGELVVHLQEVNAETRAPLRDHEVPARVVRHGEAVKFSTPPFLQVSRPRYSSAQRFTSVLSSLSICHSDL